MPVIPTYLPGAYLTDGQTLLWVVERSGIDTLWVENALSGELLEVGDADLAGYRKVTPSDGDKQPQAGSRRSANSKGVRDRNEGNGLADPRTDQEKL